MNIWLKSMTIGLCLIVGSQAMEVEEKNLLNDGPPEIKEKILEYAVMDNCIKLGNANELASVCKEWFLLINTKGNEESRSLMESCLIKIFLNGKLIYKPDQNSDDGKMEMCISDLKKPLEGEFDLSKCGDAGQYLSISTGYRKGMKPENANKVEIWIVLRSEIEKELKNGRASHFKDIMDKGYWKDNAPIGIFWTWGEWNNLKWYDYLTSENITYISNDNLYEKWMVARCLPYRWQSLDYGCIAPPQNFMFVFCEPK